MEHCALNTTENRKERKYIQYPFTIDTVRNTLNEPAITAATDRLGIVQYPKGRSDGKPCDIYWHSLPHDDVDDILPTGLCRFNKFPGMTGLTNKVKMTHALASMRKMYPDEPEFYPRSFVLPQEANEFQQYWASETAARKRRGEDPKLWFIVKPDEGHRGQGIYLISNPEEVQYPEDDQVIQEYFADPFLLDDKLKFDLRIYVVVESIDPLKIHIAKEGLVRFCTEPYVKPTKENFKNSFSHVTNYSLNKYHDLYRHSPTVGDEPLGHKRRVSTVFEDMARKGVNTDVLWQRIEKICIESTIAMWPEIMLHYQQHFKKVQPDCFHILGYDILIRDNGVPILLEGNAAPALTLTHFMNIDGKEVHRRSVVDEMIKKPVAYDSLLLALGLFEKHYHKRSRSLSPQRFGTPKTITPKKAPVLEQIFPMERNAYHSRIVVLRRLMNLFRQYAPLQDSVTMSLAHFKVFLRDTYLDHVISDEDLEVRVKVICKHFKLVASNDRPDEFPFNGFLSLFFHLATLQYGHRQSLITKTIRLIGYCERVLGAPRTPSFTDDSRSCSSRCSSSEMIINDEHENSKLFDDLDVLRSEHITAIPLLKEFTN